MPDIDFQKIVLNLIPKKGDEPVIFYASQYETARPFIADLMWGESEFAPGVDCWAEIDIRKNDDNLVVITDDVSIDNNEVSVILPVQALTCIGKNLGQVKIYAADDQLVAALNFILEVQADPLACGVTSETAIDNLTEQIEEITQQVIGDDYYNKTEVDDLLDDKADKATTYTKTEVDTALNLKADKSTTYTKTQVDNALALKADKSDTYTKTQVDTALSAKANTADLATVATTGDYDDLINKPSIPAAQVQSDYAQADNTQVDYIKNKPDIDAMIANALLAVMPVDSASGPIASFDTELAVPFVNVSCDIVATGGNGTPDNPNPINGYSSANITRCGVNLFDDNKLVIASYPYSSMTFDKATYLKAGTYTASISNVENASSWRFGFRFFNSDGTIITSAITNGLVSFTSGTAFLDAYDSNQTCLQATDNTATSVQFTLTKDTYIVGCISNGNVGASTTLDYQIETGNTASAYHPYTGNTYTIAFGQTVYGGVVDVTRGKLHVTCNIINDMSTLAWLETSIPHVFYVGISGKKAGYTSFLLCEQYTKYEGYVSGIGDNQISSNASLNNIYVRNDNCTTVSDITTALSNCKLVYELATPFDIDLTPEVISAVVGTNNVYSDTNGDTTVQFKDSIQHYIDSRT